jgi:hypothetical protein
VDVAQTFCDLLHRRYFRHITVLKLDRCCGLNLQTLFSSIPAVECHFQISAILTFLTLIATSAMRSSLDSLSISGNLATTPIAPGMARLHAEEIEWGGDSFADFWEVVLRAAPSGLLEISVANVRQARLWTFLAGACSDHITSLNWAGCQISGVFFATVTRFTQLAALDVSGCLTKSDGLLPDLTSLVRTSRTLTQLTVCGSALNALGLADVKALAAAIVTVVLSGRTSSSRCRPWWRRAGRRERPVQPRGVAEGAAAVAGPLDIGWPEFEMALLLKGSPDVRPKVRAVRELWEAVVAGTCQKVEMAEENEIDRSASMDFSVFKETPPIGEVFSYVAPELTADQLAIPAWIAARASSGGRALGRRALGGTLLTRSAISIAVGGAFAAAL